jgi:type IV pilus assembly protein PilY1
VRRSAESFDGDSAAAPILYVSYDPDSVDEDACVNQTFQAAVVSGADDAEERSDQSMYMDSSDLELVEDGSAQTVGIRFRNVQIPKDTTIIKAELVFTTDETGSSASSLTIRGEAADDSAAIGTSSGNLSSRSTTSASASWSPAGWATVGETHATPDLVAIVQEIVNRSGWEAGNAMTFLITGSGTRTAESYDGSASGAPVLRVMVQGALGTGYVTVRDKLQEIVDGLNYKSGTPILDTLYEAASYYRGESVHYGRSRGFGSDPDDGSFGEDDRNRCEYTRLSHPASYTGGSVVRPVGCSEDEPNSTSCVDEYISGDPVYITPMTQWCQANYQILLSDGLGYGTQSVSLTNELFSAGYACSNHDDCSVELAEFLRKEDQNDTLDEDQTVTTYTIGFNLESTDPQFLRDVASAGGGSFYTADTAEELSTVFQSILADILSRSTSFTAPAVSVNAFNRLFHDNDVYFSLFLPQRSVRWSGNLKRYLVCAGAEGDSCTRGDIMDASSPPIEAIGANNRFDANSRSFWSLAADGGEVQMGGAGDNIPAYGSRLVYTYTGSAAPSNVDLSSAAHLITTTDAANAADDPLRVLLGAASLSDTDYSQLIYWILGQDVNDEDDDGQSTDDRWAFADPLHSQPLVVTYGRDGSNNPIKKIFIGSNDGALRMVNASTGVEEWVFIPQALLEMQHQLMVNASGDHLYGMDGDITVRLLDLDGDGVIEPPGDKVWIFAGMRRGGRNLYALDVTPGSTLTQGGTTDGIVPKLLWRIEGGVSSGFGALGQTWSAPRVAKIPFASSYKEVLLFGGGYQTDQDSGFATASVGNAIYAVDLSNGSLLFSVSGADSGATHELTGMDYPIPSSLALMDSSGDGLVDRIYVGDTGGQLWRLDLQRTDLGVSASGARLASVSSILSDSDKRKFFYPPDVAQLYDSDHSATAEYDLVIIVSGDRANPTETTVHNRVYGFRDYTIQGAIAADFATLDPSTDLYDATANLIQQGTDAQREAALAAIKQKKGWYMDLSESGTWIGEKGLSSPIILDNKAFFTTYVPGANESPNDSCGSPVEGYGRLYALNILNAAAVYPNWDGTGDTANLTKEDRDYDLWAGIPSNVVPVFQPGGVTLVVGGGGGGGTFDPDIDLPVVRTFWLQER